jgi:hypothetical protein
MGYKTTTTTPALVELRVSHNIGADENGWPDFSGLVDDTYMIPSGLQIASNVNSELIYETLGEIDFTISSSADVIGGGIGLPTSYNTNGIANGYTLTRYINAISGETKTKSFTISSPTKFLELDLGVSNVIEILDCRDSSGQKWYEVDYLTQDRILKQTHYLTDGRGRADNQDPVGGLSASIDIPYTLEYIKNQ